MPQTSLLPILEDRALEGRYSDALQALRLQGCASHASSETLEESVSRHPTYYLPVWLDEVPLPLAVD